MRPYFDSKKRLTLVRERLQQARKANNISQEDLAGNLHCNRATIRRWENEPINTTDESNNSKQSTPSIERLFQLCELYKCEPGYLLCEYDERSVAAKDITENLGILQNGYDKLKALKEEAVTNPSNPSTLALSFINYLTEHIDALSSLLYEKHKLEDDTYRFNILRKEDSILDLLYEYSLSWFPTLNTTVNPYNSFSINERIHYFISFVCKKKDIDNSEENKPLIDEIYDKAQAYAHVLDPIYKLQIDYALSEAFHNILSGFFSNNSNYSMEVFSDITRPPQKPETPGLSADVLPNAQSGQMLNEETTNPNRTLYIPANEKDDNLPELNISISGGKQKRKKKLNHH